MGRLGSDNDPEGKTLLERTMYIFLIFHMDKVRAPTNNDETLTLAKIYGGCFTLA